MNFNLEIGDKLEIFVPTKIVLNPRRVNSLTLCGETASVYITTKSLLALFVRKDMPNTLAVNLAVSSKFHYKIQRTHRWLLMLQILHF